MGSVIGANIRRLRDERGWSQARLGRETCRIAGLSADSIGRKEISRYELGRRTPREWLPFIAQALGVTIADLKVPCAAVELAKRDRPPGLSVARGDEFAHGIRRMSARLVALDNEMHGLPIAEMAARSFKTVHRRLGDGSCVTAKCERDVQSAAAELAEIAGWALFNEGKFTASRRFNQEALFLAQLSRDRSVELITLQNMGMLAGWTGRSREELAIARSVIERHALTPRVEAMFRAREAQGLAASGQPSEAARSFDRARSLLQDSGPDDEPYWAWWVTEREIDRQQGRALHVTGRWREAIPVLVRAMEFWSEAHVGYGNVASVRLLDCLLEASSWREAEEEAGKLLPVLAEMSSVVTLNLLEKVASRGRELTKAPSGLRDVLHRISIGMDEDPYEI
ncbi:helix-turn-helix domain-containing protein [Streptomyces sp. NPDC052396]|uniref:helix-turn-helix domain-containing protein n=1 Tax=Streptomyces sp. NPDC052396 TaxID=3365689 RepID=UPI0037D78D65